MLATSVSLPFWLSAPHVGLVTALARSAFHVGTVHRVVARVVRQALQRRGTRLARSSLDRLANDSISLVSLGLVGGLAAKHRWVGIGGRLLAAG